MGNFVCDPGGKHRLRMFENKFVPKRQEVTGSNRRMEKKYTA
jgi:hypothetical protein